MRKYKVGLGRRKEKWGASTRKERRRKEEI
jgi:hypothetical protein